MTNATERIRALLNERRVEYVANDGEHVKETCWSYMGELTAAFAEYDNGTTRFACDTWCFTPEQAIAATLGSCNCSNSERTDAPRLPHFWTHDGALHIEATRMPTRIVVCEGGTCEFVPKRWLDTSEAENAKLREHIASFKELSQDMVIYAGQNMKRHFAKRLRKLGVPL